MPGKINGFTVAYSAAGGLVLYSGIKGTSLADTFRGLASGTLATSKTEDIGVPELSLDTGGTASTSTPSTAGMASGTAAENQAIARVLAAPYGWSTGTQWTDLVNLWNKESSWNNKAVNSSSGAYGIPQALPPTKMPASAQASGGSSASAQISWGLSYIKSTYGSPEAAWAHEESAGWY